MGHQHHHPNTINVNISGQKVAGQKSETRAELFRLAFSATFHCLIGCGIGEVLGMIISAAIGLSNLHSIILSVILGFIGGLLLGILPLKKFGFGLRKALNVVIAGEGLSILVMETFEVLTEVFIPGVMTAHLTDSIFWIGMAAALVVGFIAAFPVNYIFIKRGFRHNH